MKKKTSRTISTLLVGGALTLALTGCIRLEATIKINPDGETASASYVLAYKKTAMAEALKESGQTYEMDEVCEVIKENQINSSNAPTNAVWSETADECVTTITEEFGYNEEGLTKLSEDNALVENTNLSIKREGDKTRVSFKVDEFSKENSSESLKLYDKFELKVAFPGEINEASHEGVIADNTVTWGLDQIVKASESDEDLTVLGSTSASSLNLIVIGVISVAVLSVIGLVIFLALKRKELS